MKTYAPAERFCSALLSLLLVLFWLSLVSCAKKDVLDYHDFFDANECARALQEASEGSDYTGKSVILELLGKDVSALPYAYKLHSLKNGDIRPLADLNRSLRDSISEDYSWIFGTETQAWVEVRQSTDPWLNGAFRVALFKEANAWPYKTLVSLEMLRDAVPSLSVKNITAFSALLWGGSPETFVYIEAAEGEFLMPFSIRPDFTKMENGKLYTRAEVAGIVSREFPDMLKRFDDIENGVPSESELRYGS